MRFRKSTLILAVIPAGLFILSFYLHSVKGPYHLGYNLDPEYPYLFNSLNILNFEAPFHTDHPGTPLQVLGALVLLVKWLPGCILGSCEALNDSVLGDPERYLRAINIFLNILIAAGVFLAGLKILRACKALLPALAFQLTALLFLNTYKSLARVSAEPLLVFAVLMLSLALIPEVFAGDSAESSANGKKRAVITGIAIGFGVATKVTFLPLLILILLFKGLEKRGLALLGFLGSLIILTLPIITAYKRMLKWFISLFIFKGRYGQGSPGVLDINQLPGNLEKLFSAEPFLFISLGFYLLFYIMLTMNRADEDSSLIKRCQRLLWIGCLVIAAQIAMTIKHPAAHYMVPAMAITGLLNASIVFLALKLSRRDLPSRISVVLTICFLVVGLGSNSIRSVKWTKRTESKRLEAEELLNRVNTLEGCLVVGYYRSSLSVYAIAFGNDFSGNRYGAKLMQLYPDVISYNIWSKNFYFFNGPLSRSWISTAIKQGHCIVLAGSPFTGTSKKYSEGFILEPIMIKSSNALYRLKGLSK